MKISLTSGSEQADRAIATSHGQTFNKAVLEFTKEMISSSLKNIEKRLKLVVERRGIPFEN